MSEPDIRVKIGLTDHHKTIRLQRACGLDAFRMLIRLWCVARIRRPKGDLSDLSDEEIEIAAGWNGEVGKFVAALREIRWMDGKQLHDWEEHQSWAFGAPERSKTNKKNANARWAAERQHKRVACESHTDRLPLAMPLSSPFLSSPSQGEEKKNPLPPTPTPEGAGEVPVLPGMPKLKQKRVKKDRGYTAEEHNAIDVSKAYWRELCLKLNTPAKMGGACDEHIVRYCKRPDGGKDRLLEALHRLNDHLPRREMWDRPWWNLEWVVRDKASAQAGGRPVNRPAEILEGAWDEPTAAPVEEYINCPVCHGIIGSSCTCKQPEETA